MRNSSWRFRWVWALLLASSGGCVTVPYHSCLEPCGAGSSCDTEFGRCRVDPCEGRCVRGERCEAGPPPHCEIVPLSEIEVTRPDTSSPAGGLH